MNYERSKAFMNASERSKNEVENITSIIYNLISTYKICQKKDFLLKFHILA